MEAASGQHNEFFKHNSFGAKHFGGSAGNLSLRQFREPGKQIDRSLFIADGSSDGIKLMFECRQQFLRDEKRPSVISFHLHKRRLQLEVWVDEDDQLDVSLIVDVIYEAVVLVDGVEHTVKFFIRSRITEAGRESG